MNPAYSISLTAWDDAGAVTITTKAGLVDAVSARGTASLLLLKAAASGAIAATRELSPYYPGPCTTYEPEEEGGAE